MLTVRLCTDVLRMIGGMVNLGNIEAFCRCVCQRCGTDSYRDVYVDGAVLIATEMYLSMMRY